MYSNEDLVTVSGASKRQIREWNSAGFLPPPIRPPQPGLNGRGPYLFPDPAPEVARWLKVYRQSIKGNDSTRLWLWLEGGDYLGIDAESLQAAVNASAQMMQAVMRSMFPSIFGEPVTVDMEALKDDISREARTGRWDAEAERVVHAMLDIPEETSKSQSGTVTLFSALQAIDSIRNHSKDRLPVDGLIPDDCPPFTRVVDTFSMLRAGQRQLSVHDARILWQAINAVIEHSANESVTNPWGKFGRSFRRKAFTIEPHLAICALAVCASMVGKENLQRLARHYGNKAEKPHTSTRTAARHSSAAS